jgi:hypothetical protein
LPQALVFVPNAATASRGGANLTPLGPATEALHIELVPPATSSSAAHAGVSINSMGLIDNIQMAATGLKAGKTYRLVLVGESARQDLVVFSAGIGGTAIVQTFGPIKHSFATSQAVPALKLEVRSAERGVGDLVLQQPSPSVIHRKPYRFMSVSWHY